MRLLLSLWFVTTVVAAAPVADGAKRWIGKNVYFLPQDASRGEVYEDSRGTKKREVRGNAPAKVLAVGKGDGLVGTLFQLRFADGTTGWARAIDLVCAGIWCEDDHPQRLFPDPNPRAARADAPPARAGRLVFRPGDYLDGTKHLALKATGRKGFRFQFTVESPNGRECSLQGTLGRGAAEFVRGSCRVRFERHADGREWRYEVTSTYGCGDTCTHGEWYGGHYFPAPNSCVPKSLAEAHEAFQKARTREKAKDALPGVEAYLRRCHDFLTEAMAADLKNDAALLELVLGRPKDCVARLEPMTKEAWFLTKEPDSTVARENISRAKSTQANLETCRGAMR